MAREGKTYFVTGGASGLGLACVRFLHEEGANVAIIDKNEELGSAVATELGSRALFVATDVMNPDSVREAFRKTIERFQTLNGIVNSAGMGWAATTVGRDGEPMSYKHWDFIIKLNLYGTFNCCSIGAAEMAKLPADKDGQRGVIVNVSSVAGIEGQKGQLVYSASKGAIIGMTLPMARDLSRYGIRVMTIAPGIMETPLAGKMPAKAREALVQAIAGPKRLGSPREFAMIVGTCIDNGYLNGEVIRLDGGIRFPNL
eukprot:c25807_g1_i1.p1 GENE.c25807_g1_i1~~c25807_g1_i1.p1  ORF type:complete len:264 (+),score=59.17 c25807_g1_i1:22-792(+)